MRKGSRIYYPVLGEIRKVWFSDTEGAVNRPFFPGNNNNSPIVAVDIFLFQIKGISGQQNITDMMYQVPVALTFGGVRNYGFITPTPTSSELKDRPIVTDGDIAIVQFINGEQSLPIVTGFYPSLLSTDNAPMEYEGCVAKFNYNGAEITITKTGDIEINTGEANKQIMYDDVEHTYKSKTIDESIEGDSGDISIIAKASLALYGNTGSLHADKDIEVIAGEALNILAPSITIGGLVDVEDKAATESISFVSKKIELSAETDVDAETDVYINSEGTLEVYSTKEMSIYADGELDIESDSDINIDGTTVVFGASEKDNKGVARKFDEIMVYTTPDTYLGMLLPYMEAAAVAAEVAKVTAELTPIIGPIEAAIAGAAAGAALQTKLTTALATGGITGKITEASEKVFSE